MKAIASPRGRQISRVLSIPPSPKASVKTEKAESAQTILRKQIRALHAVPLQACIITTGSSGGLQGILADEPGASNTILHSEFAYFEQSLIDVLGATPKQFASMDTAIQMAAVAYRRALRFSQLAGKSGQNVVGLGITAAIATNRPKKGEHKVYAALYGKNGAVINTVEIAFSKKTEGRSKGLSVIGRRRETWVSDMIGLNLLFDAAGLGQVPVDAEGVERSHSYEGAGFTSANKKQFICRIAPHQSLRIPRAGNFFLSKRGEVIKNPDPALFDDAILCPLSANPLHFGHEELAKEVARITGKRVVFALTSDHPEKGRLPKSEMRRRIYQFRFLADLVVTEGLPLYVDKADYFCQKKPGQNIGASFLIGVDTMERMLNAKYCPDGPVALLRRFEELGAHFYVAPRLVEISEAGKGGGGIVRTSNDVLNEYTIRNDFGGLFTSLGSKIHISSSEIRKRLKDEKQKVRAERRANARAK